MSDPLWLLLPREEPTGPQVGGEPRESVPGDIPGLGSGRALKPFCFPHPVTPRKNGRIVFQTEPMWSLNVPCHLGYKSSRM